MPLIDFWDTNADAVAKLSIQQIVATAGDGNLRDESTCSSELRDYLSRIPSEKIGEYAEYCLENSFSSSGFALQDMINELGRRLEYGVENGRYQGRANAIGQDGIWLSPEGDAVVIEVKTSDTYRISLDKIVDYRNRLQSTDKVPPGASILIVVGRDDTGELEAQVRGSRHAWDIRLISVEALLRLVQIKENAEGIDTGRKIRNLLRPMEYTRLDPMVDVMFTAAKEVENTSKIDDGADDEAEGPPIESSEQGRWQFTEYSLVQKKRGAILSSLARRENTNFVKRTRALYWSADRTVRVACTLSKRYQRSSSYRYWYAYHPQWNEFLREGERAFFVLGCMDLDIAFAIPVSVMQSIVGDLRTTGDPSKDGYWHVHIGENSSGTFSLLVPRRQSSLPLAEFQLMQA